MVDWIVNEELEKDLKGVGHAIMNVLYRYIVELRV
jgi:hypothetical protein